MGLGRCPTDCRPPNESGRGTLVLPCNCPCVDSDRLENMLVLTTVLALLLMIILGIQVHWANRFVALYRPASARQLTEYPHVGIVMSLRGSDPFLENNLRGLMALDYPSHEIRIIIDSQTDPAFAVVESMRRKLDARNVEIEFLKLSQKTCSLKNRALIQGIDGCSGKCEIFAWLDSDTVPHPNWLHELIVKNRVEIE